MRHSCAFALLLVQLTWPARAEDLPRAPVPDAEAQVKAEKVIKEVYQKEFARRKASDHVDLAQRLLKEATDTKDDLATKFVLLREARDLAAKAGDSGLVLKVAEQMGREFAVSATVMLADGLDVAARSITTVNTNRVLAETALLGVGPALVEDQYEAAARLLKLAQPAAQRARSTALVSAVQLRRKDLEVVQKEHEAVIKDLATLEKDPGDAAANLRVGKFLCFYKGQWAEGLPRLVKGNDAKLKVLAQKDLDMATQAMTQLEVGDGWWDQLEGQPDLVKWQLQRRAAHWYQQALPELMGLAKTKTEKRVKQYETVALRRGEVPPIYRHIQAAVRGGRIRDTRQMGSGDIPFREVPSAGALLIGFELTYGNFGTSPTINSVRGIYQTASGKSPGVTFGVPTARLVRVQAKPGYAVAGLTVKAGLGVDGMSVTFMEIQGDHLNPEKSYTSPWLGGMGGGLETKLAGDGALVVGIFGKVPRDPKSTFNGLGLVTIPMASKGP